MAGPKLQPSVMCGDGSRADKLAALEESPCQHSTLTDLRFYREAYCRSEVPCKLSAGIPAHVIVDLYAALSTRAGSCSNRRLRGRARGPYDASL